MAPVCSSPKISTQRNATSAHKMDDGPSDRKKARKANGPENNTGLTTHILQSMIKPGPDYLKNVFYHVVIHKGQSYSLNNPAGAIWKVGDLHDTIYSEEDEEVVEWGECYLPDEVSMQVVGVVEGTSCPCDQLILMTCEDRKIYAYDGEELHVVAPSLEQLVKRGIEYPATESYYNGEAFKDMTKEDWAVVRNSAVGKSLDEEHHKLVTANKSTILENLKSTRQAIGVWVSS